MELRNNSKHFIWMELADLNWASEGFVRVFDKISWIIYDLSFEFAQQKSQCAADPVVLCEGKKMWSDSINKMKQVGAGDVELTVGLTGQNCLDVFSTGLYCVSKLLESRMKWWSVGNSVQRLVFDKLLNVWPVLTLCHSVWDLHMFKLFQSSSALLTYCVCSTEPPESVW